MNMPWQLRSPQQQGRDAERDMAKSYDARPHPGSGSGRIRGDASNERELLEFKRVRRAHQLSGAALLKLFNEAVRQQQQPVYVVYFTDAGLILEGRLRKMEESDK
jgi:hypothetical protein